MIVENKFEVMLGKSKINEFIFEVERSEENHQEVLLRSYTSNGSGKTQLLSFYTDKTDEEIIDFYNKKYEMYQAKIEKKWFFLKSVPIVKFGKELELFLGKPIKK